MTKTTWLLLFLLAPVTVPGCFTGDPAPADDSAQHSHGGTTHTHADEADAESGVSVTAWTEELELFMEHPPLRVGQPARFAVHLTKLADFQPLGSGPVLFQFTAPGAEPKIVTVGSPESPGIFGPSVTFDRAGRYTMRIEILSDELEAGLEYGPVEVAAADAEPPAPDTAASSENISYLKEQQWTLPFASQEVRESTLRDTLRIAAEVKSRVGSESVVTSAVAGRYDPPPRGLPQVGTWIGRGADLGSIELLPADRSGLIDRQLTAGVGLSRLLEEAAQARSQVTAEQSRLALAQGELTRVQSLVEAEALPAKRLPEAQSEVEIRKAALEAATEALAAREQAVSRYRSSERNLDSIADRVSLAAPISGHLVAIDVVAGEYVDQAERLFHIVDLGRVWIFGKVFERDVPRLADLAGGTLELPGHSPIELSSSQLVHVGAIVDEKTRTLPVVFEIENRDHRIKLGSHGKLHLRAGGQVRGLVVPADAVLLEENQTVVYVQLEGETFERRLVQTGVRDPRWIQITNGLQAGERIVTVGAYNVALAARSTEVPDHGHVH